MEQLQTRAALSSSPPLGPAAPASGGAGARRCMIYQPPCCCTTNAALKRGRAPAALRSPFDAPLQTRPGLRGGGWRGGRNLVALPPAAPDTRRQMLRRRAVSGAAPRPGPPAPPRRAPSDLCLRPRRGAERSCVRPRSRLWCLGPPGSEREARTAQPPRTAGPAAAARTPAPRARAPNRA